MLASFRAATETKVEYFLRILASYLYSAFPKNWQRGVARTSNQERNQGWHDEEYREKQIKRLREMHTNIQTNRHGHSKLQQTRPFILTCSRNYIYIYIFFFSPLVFSILKSITLIRKSSVYICHHIIYRCIH